MNPHTPSSNSRFTQPQFGRVLVVDDEEKNRTLLRDSLEAHGHTVDEANDGEAALQHIRKDLPDVVLLDVMMPKLDGFEVCLQMKSDAALRHIPVIMVTALSERKERLMGIKAGANDFLVKPIDIPDTLLRVNNAIREKKLYDKLQDSYSQLKQLETFRDELTHMIVHDMRSPLMVIMGYIDLLKRMAKDRLHEDDLGLIKGARESTVILKSMIDNLLDVSRLEANEMPIRRETCDLKNLVNQAVEEMAPFLREKQCICNLPETPLEIKADSNLLSRVLTNLLGNACKFSPKKGGRIDIAVSGENGQVRIDVADNGPGIPEKFQERIFEKFGQAENTQAKNSSGLGLTFCKLAVERHGGSINVRNRPEGGSLFWIILNR
ncbi:MAG: response regulator [Opitutales bacterium]|nr:response regulator [Opitutales bacterium]